MKNTLINRRIIERVAIALEELNDDVVYVGGATVSLYVNDPAAKDVRATKDIDISVEIASISQLEELRENLTAKGFIQTADLKVICRFKLEEILLDVMGTKPIGWALANPWFELGFEKRELIEMDNLSVHIMPLPYFLASKFVAHNDRGGSDPRMSHDFEDIVYILDNRTDWHDIIINSENKVKAYLMTQFQNILESNKMQEAILGNLDYRTQEERYKKIITKIEKLFNKNNGK